MKDYTLAHDSWGIREKLAIARVVKSGMYTMGGEVMAFEREFADWHGSRNAVMVNSGSSANLVMLDALVQLGHLSPGDEVIVPAVSWSTTYFPLYQLGLVPVFVDVGKDYCIDPFEVQSAFSPRTRAVFCVNLLGAPAELSRLRGMCDAAGAFLLEDNCESLGAETYDEFRRWRKAGTFGVAGTFSFFFSHHLQTMEGGMVLTDNDQLADYMRSIRAHGWGRDSIGFPKSDPFIDKFRFHTTGYSLRPLDMSAAAGRVQLERLDDFLEQRRKNAERFRAIFGASRHLDLQLASVARSSWFGFGFTLKDTAFDRQQYVSALKAAGVETRPIVAGNFLEQPVFERLRDRSVLRSPGDFKTARRIEERGLFLGNDDRDLGRSIAHAYSAIRRLHR